MRGLSRRALLVGLSASCVANTVASAQTKAVLDIAYAGSMTSIMEGPIKRLAAERLGITLQGRAQGASGLAQLIVTETIAPDIFISVTPGPMRMVINSGKIDTARPIARTEMVIAYSPKSPFAGKLARAGKNGTQAWWQVLEEPGLRFGRTDPVTDPQGRNIIFVMQLAARFYNRPDLQRKVLGPDVNPVQIFTEPTVEVRLQTGELDAASAYKTQPTAFGLPFLRLPKEINLSDDRLQSQYAQASLTLNERVFHPEPLVYYAAVVKTSSRPKEAAAFVDWLATPESQAVFRHSGYDAALGAAPLHV
jgi:molybdate/tungstate transport system substrate-binding protein